MSTRAIYIFKDKDEQFTVYKHHDGYPSGAVQWLTLGRHLAWGGNRFEPDEAAASFVAAAKLSGELKRVDGKLAFTGQQYPTGGGVRLLNVSKKRGIFDGAPADITFAYVVEQHVPGQGGWFVTAYATSFWDGVKAAKAKEIWQGPLEEMADWADGFDS